MQQLQRNSPAVDLRKKKHSRKHSSRNQPSSVVSIRKEVDIAKTTTNNSLVATISFSQPNPDLTSATATASPTSTATTTSSPSLNKALLTPNFFSSSQQATNPKRTRLDSSNSIQLTPQMRKQLNEQMRLLLLTSPSTITTATTTTTTPQSSRAPPSPSLSSSIETIRATTPQTPASTPKKQLLILRKRESKTNSHSPQRELTIGASAGNSKRSSRSSSTFQFQHDHDNNNDEKLSQTEIFFTQVPENSDTDAMATTTGTTSNTWNDQTLKVSSQKTQSFSPFFETCSSSSQTEETEDDHSSHSFSNEKREQNESIEEEEEEEKKKEKEKEHEEENDDDEDAEDPEEQEYREHQDQDLDSDKEEEALSSTQIKGKRNRFVSRKLKKRKTSEQQNLRKEIQQMRSSQQVIFNMLRLLIENKSQDVTDATTEEESLLTQSTEKDTATERQSESLIDLRESIESIDSVEESTESSIDNQTNNNDEDDDDDNNNVTQCSKEKESLVTIDGNLATANDDQTKLSALSDLSTQELELLEKSAALATFMCHKFKRLSNELTSLEGQFKQSVKETQQLHESMKSIFVQMKQLDSIVVKKKHKTLVFEPSTTWKKKMVPKVTLENNIERHEKEHHRPIVAFRHHHHHPPTQITKPLSTLSLSPISTIDPMSTKSIVTPTNSQLTKEVSETEGFQTAKKYFELKKFSDATYPIKHKSPGPWNRFTYRNQQ